MKRILLLLILSVSCYARGTYVVEYKSTSSTAEAITVHLPSNANGTVSFVDASVYCSVECEITIERDGTAPTTTALTVQKLNASDDTSEATAFRSSNVGTGTVIGRQIFAAGSTTPMGFSNKGLTAGQNLTIRISSASGTYITNIMWKK